jgi:hypothetical protein
MVVSSEVVGVRRAVDGRPLKRERGRAAFHWANIRLKTLNRISTGAAETVHLREIAVTCWSFL